jgi:hypothetical protein
MTKEFFYSKSIANYECDSRLCGSIECFATSVSVLNIVNAAMLVDLSLCVFYNKLKFAKLNIKLPKMEFF